jgi:hypothetical protein
VCNALVAALVANTVTVVVTVQGKADQEAQPQILHAYSDVHMHI